MKSMTMFWRTVSTEVGAMCRVSTTKDFETVLRRVKMEGDAFFTLTLPAFGKDFERSLDQGQVTPDLFAGFKRRGGLPIFLGGFLELIFSRDSGTLLKDEDESPFAIEAVYSVRQLTLMFQKVLRQCSPEREDAAIDAFLECERELSAAWENFPEETLEEFCAIARVLYAADVFTPADEDVYWHRLVPKHGPGKTADRLLGNEKYDIREWPLRLERIMPYGEYALPNWRYYYLLDEVEFTEPGSERPVKVVSVPKTQKTPRIIAIEPTHMQYAQQAISRRLVDLISNTSPLGSMIGFDDQVPNQDLARIGSLDGSLATLDLSEASDRVSYPLVMAMMRNHPHLREAVDACRSTHADVPGYGVIPLSKYASMGSALTFPIEAMVFLTCVFHGIGKALNVPVTKALVREYQGRVRVYGDDIVVPVEFATSVVRSLETFTFRVNRSKSFWTGMFRESCGAEFFRGEDVSITRFRRDFPTSRADVPEVLSLVSFRNQFYMAGVWGVAKQLDEWITEVLTHYPTIHPESSVVGRHTVLVYQVDRFSEQTHSPLVRGYVVSSRIPSSECSGEGALLKCLTKEGSLPFADVRHLERQGRPDAVRMKLRWARPF